MVLFRVVKWIAEGLPVLVHGDGLQERSFTYVDDVARGVVAGLKPVGYEVVNLGSDQSVKLRDAITLAEKLLDKKAKIEYQPGKSGGRAGRSGRRHESKKTARLGTESGPGSRSRQNRRLVPGKPQVGERPDHALKN